MTDRIRRLVRAARLDLPVCERCEVRPVEPEIVCFEAKEWIRACSDCIVRAGRRIPDIPSRVRAVRAVDDGFRAADPPCPGCDGSGKCMYC